MHDCLVCICVCHLNFCVHRIATDSLQNILHIINGVSKTMAATDTDADIDAAGGDGGGGADGGGADIGTYLTRVVDVS